MSRRTRWRAGSGKIFVSSPEIDPSEANVYDVETAPAGDVDAELDARPDAGSVG